MNMDSREEPKRGRNLILNLNSRNIQTFYYIYIPYMIISPVTNEMTHMAMVSLCHLVGSTDKIRREGQNGQERKWKRK
jgi:hypothetical protein